MTLPTILTLLPLVLGLAGSQGSQDMPAVSRLVVEREVIFRVPVRPPAPHGNIEWVRGDRFKCLNTRAIRGAVLAGPDHVDLLLPGRRRVRASFAGSCPALDFYGGFYLKTDDHQVCADRDSVHSRMGGSCQIDKLHTLEPKPRD